MQLSDGAGGKAKWYTPLGKQLDSFKNLNMHLPYDMIIPVLEIYREGVKAWCPQKDLYTNVLGNFICYSQMLGT